MINGLENSRSFGRQKRLAAKISVSMPDSMMKFIDEQCAAFHIGRSGYLQMILEAERIHPRKEFTKRARG